ncbi:MAG: FAD-dependent oxidoreductase [Proteobacteria bacterium]|nr:FAD-dependent oxidoreductase [Pseudomonadota bacterium]
MEGQFNYLFTPIKIGNMIVRNRIYFGPHGNMLTTNYIIDDRYVEYHKARARGGTGLQIAGMMSVMKNSRDLAGIQEVYDEKAVPMLRKLGEAVHSEGGRMLVQLVHAGRESDIELSRLPTWAPSAIPSTVMFRFIPKAMEIEDIKETVKAFARSALFVKEAGLDGAEIHGASGYLLHEFMSPAVNQRTDEYGGSLKNRMRFPLEVIDEIRKAVGNDFVVGYRLPGDDFLQDGNTIDDYKEIAKQLEETRQIDFIHIGGPFYEGIQGIGCGMQTPLGLYVPYALSFKEAVDLPILNDFRINDPVQAENILANGQGDMVGMVRGLIADPELPNKAREGRLEEIRYCIACDQGCLGRASKGKAITCTQNAVVGFEKEIGTLEPAKFKKKVVVVGGGPAGMETARVARMRGHEVVLYENHKELGGQVNIAVKAPARKEFGGIKRYLAKQMEILGVKVNLGIEATPELIESEQPDAVVIATGTVPFLPPIPGIDQNNVVTVEDVLLEKVKVGQSVVVVDGGDGHWQCCATAEYLLDQNKYVEIITPLLFVGMELAATSDLLSFYFRVRPKGCIFTPNTELIGISGNTLTVLDIYSNAVRKIEGVNTVVLATGSRSNNRLYYALKGKVKELHAAGDCVSPRLALDAIYDGYNLGRKL